jgi:hypothetical protein
MITQRYKKDLGDLLDSLSSIKEMDNLNTKELFSPTVLDYERRNYAYEKYCEKYLDLLGSEPTAHTFTELVGDFLNSGEHERHTSYLRSIRENSHDNLMKKTCFYKQIVKKFEKGKYDNFKHTLYKHCGEEKIPSEIEKRREEVSRYCASQKIRFFKPPAPPRQKEEEEELPAEITAYQGTVMATSAFAFGSAAAITCQYYGVDSTLTWLTAIGSGAVGVIIAGVCLD